MQIDRAGWYKQAGELDARKAGEWYGGAGSGTTGALGSASRFREFSSKKIAKRRRTKIIVLSVCALLLVAAGLTAALRGGSWLKNAAAAVSTASAQQTEAPEDAEDYFESYYKTSAAINIPKTDTGTGVTLDFTSSASASMSLQDIYNMVSPAVVGITTYQNGEEYSWGTGIVFTADGYIVTNEHVLESTDSAVITFSDGTEYTAKLVGSDEETDIAVLKIDAAGLVYARFADSSVCRVGDNVVAIGNPLGKEYSGTMTNGIVSAIERSVTYNGHSMTLMQTNAALNEGNSGGPLINAYGQVVGITNMKIMSAYTSVEGIGFAIPTSVIQNAVDQIIAYGTVLGEPTIGITAGGVSEEAMELYSLPAGIFVSQVETGSDAYAQGVQVGDVITAVNGSPVTSVADVNALKENCKVGDSLALTIYRDGKTFDVSVRLVDKSTLG